MTMRVRHFLIGVLALVVPRLALAGCAPIAWNMPHVMLAGTRQMGCRMGCASASWGMRVF
jgi:hypothetical protein